MQPTRAGPAPVLVQHCAAQPTAVATVFNLLPVGRRACARRARARSGHLLLTRSPLEAPEGATHSPSPPAPPLSSPGPRSLLCSLPARARAELVVADAVRRSHRAPRYHPKYPGDPPRPLLPPRREAHRGSPCNVATAGFFNLGTAGHLRQIRRLGCLPELPEATVATPVSYSSIPPPPRARSRTLAAFSPEPIAPRRRPWRGRGHSHRSSLLSPPACSPQPQEPKALNHSSSRALQRRSRETPSSGRRLGLHSGEPRPPPHLPLAPLDAHGHGLPSGALRASSRRP